MTAWLANHLSHTDTVSVISLQMEGAKSFFPLANAVRHEILPRSVGKLTIFRKNIALRKYLRENNIDVLINVDVGICIYGIPAAFGTKTRVITWEHGNYYNNWGSRWFPYFRRFAAKCSDAMVVLTEKDRENYRLHIPSKKPVYVIPNPAEQHTFRYDPDAKVILSAGLLAPIKRFDLAIEAAAKVLPSHPGWKWIICGEGPERENLQSLIARHHLEERVLLPGSAADMAAMYQKAAVYVMTSEMEGLPMVLLEAKSWGLPIVSFDIMTGPSDIVRAGVNGYLTESGNVDDLTEKLTALMEQPELRRKFSEASQLDMEKFEEKEIVDRWNTLMKGMRNKVR